MEKDPMAAKRRAVRNDEEHLIYINHRRKSGERACLLRIDVQNDARRAAFPGRGDERAQSPALVLQLRVRNCRRCCRTRWKSDRERLPQHRQFPRLEWRIGSTSSQQGSSPRSCWRDSNIYRSMTRRNISRDLCECWLVDELCENPFSDVRTLRSAGVLIPASRSFAKPRNDGGRACCRRPRLETTNMA